MDSIRVSEAPDPGSIPGEATSRLSQNPRPTQGSFLDQISDCSRGIPGDDFFYFHALHLRQVAFRLDSARLP